jgi:hypothetical protein
MPVTESSVTTLTLGDQFGVSETISLFQRLIYLDQIWTAYLDNAEPPIPERDIQILRGLSSTMISLLKEAPDRAGYLTRITENNFGELEYTCARIIESDEITERQREALTNAIERHEGILGFAKHGGSIVRENTHNEIESLEAKMNAIENDGFSTGDLSSLFLCGVAANLVVGGLLLPVFPANVIAVGVGATVIGLIEWKGGGC